MLNRAVDGLGKPLLIITLASKLSKTELFLVVVAVLVVVVLMSISAVCVRVNVAASLVKEDVISNRAVDEIG